MATTFGQRVSPMKTSGTAHFIDRTYRESGVYQWVRETFVNAIEAGSTRIEYGVEWQAVENLGVYRRLIADDGKGMAPEELRAFFNTFGGGGKPIGGVHENFGVGAKTSLLPWNKYGVVVVSWVDGEANMIWLMFDEQTGEYGLKYFEAEDEETGQVVITDVVEPFDDDESGCDWTKVKPEWITDHGSVLVLLGNNPTEDTVLGDPNRFESDIKGVSSYLNRRVWSIPSDVTVTVDELRANERGDWPTSERMAHTVAGGGATRRTNRRRMEGAKHFVEYPGHKSGKLAAVGNLALDDATVIDWFLWDGDRPSVHTYAAETGYIAALYRNELYDVTAHPATFRSFGVSESAVRQRLWLIIRPKEFVDKEGVYPRTDRNSLLLRGGPNAGGPLPLNEWGREFAEKMPQAIRDAMHAARTGQEGSIKDETWRQRLADRFGARWRGTRYRVNPAGTATVDPVQGGQHRQRPRLRRRRSKGTTPGTPRTGQGGRNGALLVGRSAGAVAAQPIRAGVDLPEWKAVSAADIGQTGLLAVWKPNDPDYPQGVVLLNVDHPVMDQVIQYWQARFPDVHADNVCKDVIDAYGEIAVSKIAHSEHLKSLLPVNVVETELRSDYALTMSLLGLLAEEAVISPRLGGRYGRQQEVR